MTASPARSGTPHVPVMLDEVIATLSPTRGETVVDGTFGAGGYTAAVLDRGARVVALDRDPTAIEAGRTRFGDRGDLALVRERFSRLDTVVDGPVDGVMLDIGVSSMQIDRAERGFSFAKPAALDMRMGMDGPSAGDAVNGLAQADLTRVIGLLGEERNASRIARAIVEAREGAPIETTEALAAIVSEAAPRRAADRIHPATRTFQAIRIYINDELNELLKGLAAAERALRTGGRLVVVTFHSLEDRIVKRFLADRSGGGGTSRHVPLADSPAPTFEPLGKQGRGPMPEEVERNPRARSARLRAAVRLDTAARDEPFTPSHRLPPLEALGRSR